MSKLLLNKSFSEHAVEDISSVNIPLIAPILFKQKEDCRCLYIDQESGGKTLYASYYIGTDWLTKNEIAVYIAPKINEEGQEADYLKMLFSCLRHPDVNNVTKDLYEIKFNEPFIELDHKRDLLTPLLIVQFLQTLKSIVKKGLKKSYYKVEKNLHGRIKGKVLVSQSIRQNIVKNKPLNNFCQFDEFGINCIENKLLKRALIFVQKYLALFPDYSKEVQPVINFCLPAFHDVDEEVDLRECKRIKINPFYKEYHTAIHLAEIILRRFGYNIKEIEKEKKQKVKVPPFWIDMSKLFELYVLGLLKDRYQNNIIFQFSGKYGQSDFLLNGLTEKMIIDTKYKMKYQEEKYVIEDIRQLSGYGRDTKVLSKLGYKTEEEQSNTVVDCLIIYPDQMASEDLNENLKAERIDGFVKFYKMPIKLPVIGE